MDKLLFATKDKTTAAQQRTKRVVKPREFAPTGGPPGTYQADIIFFEELARANHGFKSILTAISANSRFVYAQPLKKKGDAAESMVRILADAKKREPIRFLWTDSGTEFTARKFQGLVRAENIQHFLTEPRNHAPLARVDRFHLTLRSILERWFLETNKNNWVDSLPLIIETYNEHDSRATGLKPAKTTSKDIERIRLEDKARAMRVAARVDHAHLFPGAAVRHITNKVGFTKGSAPKWSAQVHQVESRVGVNTFTVKGVSGTFKDYELQPVRVTEAIPIPVGEQEREQLRKERQLQRRMTREGIEARPASPMRLRGRMGKS